MEEEKKYRQPIHQEITDNELEAIASYKPREGMGMNFYYEELRKRNDAKWAREELDRRK